VLAGSHHCFRSRAFYIGEKQRTRGWERAEREEREERIREKERK
jgi:hypothetical protein